MDISAYQHMNIRMSTRGKRPLRNLTPSDKVRAIQRIHNGETKASVSRDIGVPESTLRGWCKNEQKLRFMCRQLGASADQMSLVSMHGGGGENPPEKRGKFDAHMLPKFPQLSVFDEFPYNRLPMPGMEFALNGGGAAGSGLHLALNNNNNNSTSNNNTSTTNNTGAGITGNAILDKIAFNEFLKNSTLQNSEDRKAFGGGGGGGGVGSGVSGVGGGGGGGGGAMGNLHLQSMMNSLPMPGPIPGNISDYTQQLSMVQNLNLLTLLNPGLAAMSAGASNASAVNTNAEGAKMKSPLRLSNSSSDGADNQSKTDSPVLSVKNWAKDPSENSSPSKSSNSSSNGSNRSRNDTNNNDVKAANHAVAPLTMPEVLPLFPLPQVPPMDLPAGAMGADSGGGLLEWCKAFNASLNFLALAAAAASLQSTPSVGGGPPLAISNGSTTISTPINTPTSSDDNASKSDSPDATADNNILYKQLTKSAAAAAAVGRSFNSAATANLNSDASNDSFFDSEPEDLSVRSATSKLSSPTVSRSQSPTKSTISSASSVHSDAEQ